MFSRFRALLALPLAAAALVACSDDNGSTGPTGDAALRVVHASPDAPNVDVLVDGGAVLTNVPFGAASDYLEVNPDRYQVQVVPAGATTPVVIDASLTLNPGGSYTVLATGELAEIAPLVLGDDRSEPAAGQVKIRVVHAAPAAAGVDVYATAPGADINTATPVLVNVPFRGVSGYLAVPAGEYQLRVTPTGTKTVAINATVDLMAGQVRTVVALDAVGGGAPLTAIVLEDLN